MIGLAADNARVVEEARALFDAGADAEAAGKLRALVEPVDAALEADVLCLRADILCGAGDPIGAMPLYERTLALRPRHAGALVGSGKIHLIAGSTGLAEELFQAASRAAPADERALIGLGLVARAKGHAGAALGWFVRAYREGGRSLRALRQTVETALESGLCEPALAPAREHAAQHPEDAEAWGMEAALCHRLGRLEEAAEAARRALELRPADPAVVALVERVEAAIAERRAQDGAIAIEAARGRSPFLAMLDALAAAIASGAFERLARALVATDLPDHPDAARLGTFLSFAPLFERACLARDAERGLIDPRRDAAPPAAEAPPLDPRIGEVEALWTRLNAHFFLVGAQRAWVNCGEPARDLGRRAREARPGTAEMRALAEATCRVLGAGVPFDVEPAGRLHSLAEARRGKLMVASHAAPPWDIVMLHGFLGELLRRGRGGTSASMPLYVINRTMAECLPAPVREAYEATVAVAVDSSHVRSADRGRENRERMEPATRGWIAGRNHLLIFPEGARNGLSVPYETRFQYGVGRLAVRALQATGEVEVSPLGAHWDGERGRLHVGPPLRFRATEGRVEVGGWPFDPQAGGGPFYGEVAAAGEHAFVDLVDGGRPVTLPTGPAAPYRTARLLAAVIARAVATTLKLAGGVTRRGQVLA